MKIDGKDLKDAPTKEIIEYKADSDHSFDKGSEISIKNYNKRTISDLTVLAKVWGFLKYYHPEVAKGNINWDYELFRMATRVLKCKSQEERNRAILASIDALGPIKADKNGLDISEYANIKLNPDLKWIEDHRELGEALSDKLLEVKRAERTEDHFYIGFVRNEGNPIFKNEKSYSGFDSLDDGYRLLSLFRYWNCIQYFFPYKHLIGEDWNQVLPEFILKFLEAKDEQSYTLVTLELIARIHDTHANIWNNWVLEANIRGKNMLPFEAKFIEGKLAVTAYYSDTLSIKEKLKIGDVISEIDGVAVKEIIKSNLKYTPASNYPTQLRDLAKTLLRTNKNELKLSIERNGKSMDRVLTTTGIGTTNRHSVTKKPGYSIIEDSIGYVYPASYKNEDLSSIKKMFISTKGIIVDMRCYPSAFMPYTFGAYIKQSPGVFAKFTKSEFRQPGMFRFSSPVINGEWNGEHYRRKVVVIVNEQTQSQAEFTTMALQSSPDVIVIGSTTAGADGNVSSITLPGNINTRISGLGVYYPDGTETQRVGVKIDIPVKPTLNGIRTGKDELLEKAKEIIRESSIN